MATEVMPRCTTSASAKVSDRLVDEADPGMRLRVAVRPGGCSGFSAVVAPKASPAAVPISCRKRERTGPA
jgi:Fe-S cluster assembly iron-binding protein IscA